MNKCIIFLTRYGTLGASTRLRSIQYQNLLEEYGFMCKNYPFITNDMLKQKYNNTYNVYDIIKSYFDRLLLLFKIKYKYTNCLIWIEKEALPWMPAFIEKFFLSSKEYILDYDDAIFHNYDLNDSFLVKNILSNKIRQIIFYSSAVIAGNKYLAEYAIKSKCKIVKIIPTVVDIKKYQTNGLNNKIDDCPIIVWIGSPSTTKYLKQIESVLIELAKKYVFYFRVVGGSDVEIPGVNIQNYNWNETTEVQILFESDIGVMPLDNTPWSNGKCGYKIIQYMASNLPVVASPIGANNDIVCHGLNGYLAHNNDDWYKYLEKLLNNKELRINMGVEGRKTVEEQYTISKSIKQIIDLIEEVN